MEKIVVDASVVVKWFVKEEGSNEALNIRNSYIAGEVKLIAPELIIFEVLNALYFKKLFSSSEIKEIAEALEAYSLELCPLRGQYAKKTVEISFENNITIYDASYIALAILKNAELYTADKKLIAHLKKDYQGLVKGL